MINPSASPALTGLHDQFPEKTVADWEKAVLKTLKEGNVADLSYYLDDTIKIAPLYTADHINDCLINDPDKNIHIPVERLFSGWSFGAHYDDPDLERCNQTLLADLAGGCNALALNWPKASEKAGLPLYTLTDLQTVLKDVSLSYVSPDLFAGSDFFPAAILQLGAWEKTVAGGSAEERRQITGHLNADPLGSLAKEGTLATSLDQSFEDMAALSIYCDAFFPKVTSIAVDGCPYYEAGANNVQTLAYMLSTAITYLRELTDRGMTSEAAFAQIHLIYPVSGDFFLNIATLRCLSHLWGRIGLACALKTPPTPTITAIMAQRVLTKYDPWGNVLRASITCAASGMGGADRIYLRPYDQKHGISSQFAHRLMRNIQIIAQEESGLHKVADPAAGAWAIESLTTQLAEKSWDLFQQLEKKGGLIQALRTATLAQSCLKGKQDLLAKVSCRTHPITGVTEFPTQHTSLQDVRPVSETAPPPPSTLNLPYRDIKSLITATHTQNATLTDLQHAGLSSPQQSETLPLTVPRLAQFYLAEQFENLRDLVSHHMPAPLHIIALGSFADHTARLNFALNTLQTIGLSVETHLWEEDPGIIAKLSTRTPLSCLGLCGPQQAYITHLPDILSQLTPPIPIAVVAKQETLSDFSNQLPMIYLNQECDLIPTLCTLLHHLAPTIPLPVFHNQEMPS